MRKRDTRIDVVAMHLHRLHHLLLCLLYLSSLWLKS
jgi:hypothetical protein